VRVLRLPIRVRLTLAFAIAVAAALTVVGILVYAEFDNGLNKSIDVDLRQREQELERATTLRTASERVVDISGERYIQVYDRYGNELAASRRATGPRMLTSAQVQRAERRPVVFTDTAEPGTRTRAFRIRGERVAAIGESLARVDETRDRLALLLAIALPGALIASSIAGYRVAGAGLRPVERMRARAAAITDRDLAERLPISPAGDELSRLGTTLNELLDRLDATIARERRLVSDASHELRTPLATLRAELEAELARPADPDRQRAVLESALEEAQRLSRLADDLLVLARADQGELPLRPALVEVQDLLEAAQGRHAAAAARAGRTIGVEVDIRGGGVLLADRDRTDQILDNLIANSLVHGAGPIELEARRADGEKAIALTVRDHGPGFRPSFRARAFERFSQDNSGAASPGAGLGLALVATLARAQGGEVALDDGAGVTVTLPTA
jgi:two-component system, OmpR family, sensor kinase